MDSHREPVLDQGYVELVDFLGDDDAPADAARVSFAKSASHYTTEQNDKLTRYLIEHDHGSPFEMVTFKFRVLAPVVVWWQWVRHRHASYNFESGRYIPLRDDRVHLPTGGQWRMQSTSNKQGSAPGQFVDPMVGEFYTATARKIFDEAFALYARMLDAGVAKEQARLVLPFAATYYEAIVQMNARSLMNFLRLREDGHAQHEIREYAHAIRRIVAKTHPRLFGGSAA